MNEIEGTRPNSCSQAFARWNQEVKTLRMVSNISVQLNFTGTKTQFAEIFHTDIHEAQIFKIRGFRSTLQSMLHVPLRAQMVDYKIENQ